MMNRSHRTPENDAQTAESSAFNRVTAWLQPQEIDLDVEVPDRAGAFEFIAEAIARRHSLEPRFILRALERREQACSTGLGNGFAIPHARIANLNRPLTMFVRTKQPIGFSAPDGRPVSDILTIMVPEDGAKQDHLQLLGLVAELFSDQVFRGRLDGAVDASIAAEVFRSKINEITQRRLY